LASSSNTLSLQSVDIDKLVHGGQGLGVLPDGKKVFVWNALPGEKVLVRLLKSKRSYAEGIAEEIVEASPERVEPKEQNYLATSPWQILDFVSENKYKKAITQELFTQAGVELPDFTVTTAGSEWHYRNKMEYSFWGDDDGLHLALYKRGSHGKEIVTGSMLALPALDKGANAVLTQLNNRGIRASDLKTIIIRSSQKGAVVAALFVKPGTFPKLDLPTDLQGLQVYHSNPKSPASVPTKLLYSLGDLQLHDELLGKRFVYDVNSFFQVNVPIFEAALLRMQEHADDSLTDMYAGVGSIGLSLAKKQVSLIELDPKSAAMARVNAANSGLKAKVIEASSERALDYVSSDRPIIFDPPRAGLHRKLTEQILEVKPPKVIYLSCNPVTQARDLALLQESYTIKHFEVFNFFPHTPHIESLAILEKS
jgi:23S rRNA (uracil1939-C5)-methyltransferase